jgi:superfamily II DNA or RNA helicase
MSDDVTPFELSYDRGTVLVAGGPPGFDHAALPGVRYDPRTTTHRAQGRHYRGLVEHLVRNKIAYTDTARGWDNKPQGWTLHTDRTPRDYQSDAVAEWWAAKGRGVVVLPTGSGKSFVGSLAIQKANRPTLIVVPTLVLMNQWFADLGSLFKTEVGLLGGGYYDFKPLTVTTYDSAYIHLERWGHKFGMLVFDEAHHLPGSTFQEAAVGSLAPYRLGLTATPERQDGAEAMLPELIGPIVFRRDIQEFAGEFLADYTAKLVYVDLTPDEEEAYRRNREHYRKWIADRNISVSGPQGWQRFIFEASKTPDGWEALRAYREQKRIERQASGKFHALDDILKRHAGERSIIFTADNATVYQIARKYLVPAITNQTKAKERKVILEKFHSGEYSVIVSCQVLNEGVDVPAASVGVVLSGTGSVKENVQRLGRILRKYGDKQATLYEIIARGTAEEYTSDRRRQHGAFQ